MSESLDSYGEVHASPNATIQWVALHLRNHLETLDDFCERKGIDPDQAAGLRHAYTSALFELSTLSPDTTISQAVYAAYDGALEQCSAILTQDTR